ncbi:MAG: hypothetical protein ACJATY_001257 [Spirosomataceae bacterium]|jgi:hypothetical protein
MILLSTLFLNPSKDLAKFNKAPFVAVRHPGHSHQSDFPDLISKLST